MRSVCMDVQADGYISIIFDLSSKSLMFTALPTSSPYCPPATYLLTDPALIV